ncbi:MAG: DUF488 domain-containing protein [Candidatus Acidiferrum sp.]
MIQTKRVYEKAAKGDGYRVLVDRLWPRGLTKEKARVDLWMKEIGPSDELRKWFHHEEGSWSEFEKRYKSELTKKEELLGELRKLHREHGTVTLLYGSKDEKQNQAVVLTAMLKK